jgi:hypothetical protein
MYHTEPESKGYPSNRKADTASSRAGYFSKDHAKGFTREARNEIIAFHNPRHQGRIQAITRHSGLILDLQQIMPASISEIAEVVGQSTSAVRNHLRQLIQLDLVIKTSFEQHSLYCLNGCYNVHIARILTELFD